MMITTVGHVIFFLFSFGNVSQTSTDWAHIVLGYGLLLPPAWDAHSSSPKEPETDALRNRSPRNHTSDLPHSPHSNLISLFKDKLEKTQWVLNNLMSQKVLQGCNCCRVSWGGTVLLRKGSATNTEVKSHEETALDAHLGPWFGIRKVVCLWKIAFAYGSL